MGDTQSAHRDGRKDEAAEEESGTVEDAQEEQSTGDKPFVNNGQISEIAEKADSTLAGVNGHFEDEVAADAVLSPDEDVSETDMALKAEAPLKLVESVETRSTYDAEAPVDAPHEMIEIDAKRNDVNDSFRRFFSNIGLRLTIKRGSTDLLNDLPDETNNGEPNSQEDVEDAAEEPENENVEIKTDMNTAPETCDNDSTTCPTLTDVTTEEILENAEEKATEANEDVGSDNADAETASPVVEDSHQGGTSEEERHYTSSPEQDEVVSPIKRFFTSGIFSGLRKKRKPADDEPTEKEMVDMGRNEAEEMTEETEQDQQRDKECVDAGVEAAAVETELKEIKLKEISGALAVTIDEGKSPSKGPTTIVIPGPEILNSQEKNKVQSSPLKRLMAGSSFKRLTKKPRGRRSSDSRLSDSGEHASDQLMSSSESAEIQKEEGGCTVAQSSPEAAGEEEGPWASFKKLLTPKKHRRASSLCKKDSETQATVEEPKPNEGEQISDHSTEEGKKRKDSVSWEAVLCGSGKKRTRKTSDSEEETPEDDKDTKHDLDSKHRGEMPPENTTEKDNENVVSSPKQVDSPLVGDGESTWRSFKRLVTPKRKAKDDDESKDNVQSDSEVSQDESSFSIKRLLPGRKKRKSTEKQDQVSSDEAEKVPSGDEDSETPAVVPLSEFDTDESAVQIQTQADIESHSPKEADYQQDLIQPVVPCDTMEIEETKLEENYDALEKQVITTPAKEDVKELISKHQQLSDITEEGIITETMATPASVNEEAGRDETIAEDLMEITSEAITAPEPVSVTTLADETEMISAVSQLTSESSKTSGNTTPVPAEYEVMETDALLHQVVETISESPKVAPVSSPNPKSESIVGSVFHQLFRTFLKEGKEKTILEMHKSSDATAFATGQTVKELEGVNELAATVQTESISELNGQNEALPEVLEKLGKAEMEVDEVHRVDPMHPEQSVKELDRYQENESMPVSEEMQHEGSLTGTPQAESKIQRMDSKDVDSPASVEREITDKVFEEEQGEDELKTDDDKTQDVQEPEELQTVQTPTSESKTGGFRSLKRVLSGVFQAVKTLGDDSKKETEVKVEPEKEDELEIDVAKTELVQEIDASKDVISSKMDSEEEGKSEDLPAAETTTSEPQKTVEEITEVSAVAENEQQPLEDASEKSVEKEVISEDVQRGETATDEFKEEIVPLSGISLDTVVATQSEQVQESEVLHRDQEPPLDSESGGIMSLEEEISHDTPEMGTFTDDFERDTKERVEPEKEDQLETDLLQTEHVQEPEELEGEKASKSDYGELIDPSQDQGVKLEDLPPAETITVEQEKTAEYITEDGVEPDNEKPTVTEDVQEPEVLESVQAPTEDASVQSLEREVMSGDAPEAETTPEEFNGETVESEDVPDTERDTDEPKEEEVPLTVVTTEKVDTSISEHVQESEALQAEQEQTLDEEMDNLAVEIIISEETPAVETVTNETTQETEIKVDLEKEEELETDDAKTEESDALKVEQTFLSGLEEGSVEIPEEGVKSEDLLPAETITDDDEKTAEHLTEASVESDNQQPPLTGNDQEPGVLEDVKAITDEPQKTAEHLTEASVEPDNEKPAMTENIQEPEVLETVEAITDESQKTAEHITEVRVEQDNDQPPMTENIQEPEVLETVEAITDESQKTAEHITEVRVEQDNDQPPMTENIQEPEVLETVEAITDESQKTAEHITEVRVEQDNDQPPMTENIQEPEVLETVEAVTDESQKTAEHITEISVEQDNEQPQVTENGQKAEVLEGIQAITDETQRTAGYLPEASVEPDNEQPPVTENVQEPGVFKDVKAITDQPQKPTEHIAEASVEPDNTQPQVTENVQEAEVLKAVKAVTEEPQKTAEHLTEVSVEQDIEQPQVTEHVQAPGVLEAADAVTEEPQKTAEYLPEASVEPDNQQSLVTENVQEPEDVEAVTEEPQKMAEYLTEDCVEPDNEQPLMTEKIQKPEVLEAVEAVTDDAQKTAEHITEVSEEPEVLETVEAITDEPQKTAECLTEANLEPDNEQPPVAENVQEPEVLEGVQAITEEPQKTTEHITEVSVEPDNEKSPVTENVQEPEVLEAAEAVLGEPQKTAEQFTEVSVEPDNDQAQGTENVQQGVIEDVEAFAEEPQKTAEYLTEDSVEPDNEQPVIKNDQEPNLLEAAEADTEQPLKITKHITEASVEPDNEQPLVTENDQEPEVLETVEAVTDESPKTAEHLTEVSVEPDNEKPPMTENIQEPEVSEAIQAITEEPQKAAECLTEASVEPDYEKPPMTENIQEPEVLETVEAVTDESPKTAEHLTEVSVEQDNKKPPGTENVQEPGVLEDVEAPIEEASVQSFEKEVISEDPPQAETTLDKFNEETVPLTEIDSQTVDASKSDNLQETDVSLTVLESTASVVHSLLPLHEVTSQDMSAVEAAVDETRKQETEIMEEPEEKLPVETAKTDAVEEPTASQHDVEDSVKETKTEEYLLSEVDATSEQADERGSETITLTEDSLEQVGTSKTEGHREPEDLETVQESALEPMVDSPLPLEKMISQDIPAVETVTGEPKMETEVSVEPEKEDKCEIETETEIESVQEQQTESVQEQETLHVEASGDHVQPTEGGVKSEDIVPSETIADETQKTAQYVPEVSVEPDNQKTTVNEQVQEPDVVEAVQETTLQLQEAIDKSPEKEVISEDVQKVEEIADEHKEETGVRDELEEKLPIEGTITEHVQEPDVLPSNLEDTLSEANEDQSVDVLVMPTSIEEDGAQEQQEQILLDEKETCVHVEEKTISSEDTQESGEDSAATEDASKDEVEADVFLKSTEEFVDAVQEVEATEAKVVPDVCPETEQKVEHLSSSLETEDKLINEENMKSIQEVIQRVVERSLEIVSKSAVVSLEQPDAVTTVGELAESESSLIVHKKEMEDGTETLTEIQDKAAVIICDVSTTGQQASEDDQQTLDIPVCLDVSIDSNKENLVETQAEEAKSVEDVKAGKLESCEETEITDAAALVDSTDGALITTQPELLNDKTEEPVAEAAASPLVKPETTEFFELTEAAEDGNEAVEEVEPLESINSSEMAESKEQTELPVIYFQANESIEPMVHFYSVESAVVITQPEIMEAGEHKIEIVEPEAEAPASPTPETETKESLTATDVSEPGSQEESAIEPLTSIPLTEIVESKTLYEQSEVDLPAPEIPEPVIQIYSTEKAETITQPEAVPAGEDRTETVAAEAAAPSSPVAQTERGELFTLTDVPEDGGQEAAAVESVVTISEPQRSEIQMEIAQTEANVQREEITDPEVHLDPTDGVLIMTPTELLNDKTVKPVPEAPASPTLKPETTEFLQLTDVAEEGNEAVDEFEPVEEINSVQLVEETVEPVAEAPASPLVKPETTEFFEFEDGNQAVDAVEHIEANSGQMTESKKRTEEAVISVQAKEIIEPLVHFDSVESAVIITQPEILEAVELEVVEPEAEEPASPILGAKETEFFKMTDVADDENQAVDAPELPETIVSAQPAEGTVEPEVVAPTSPILKTEATEFLELTDVAEDENQAVDAVEPESKTQPEQTEIYFQAKEFIEPMVSFDTMESAVVITQPEILEAGDHQIETVETDAKAPASPTPQTETNESLTVTDVSDVGEKDVAVETVELKKETPTAEIQMKIEPSEVNVQPAEIPAAHLVVPEGALIITQPEVLETAVKENQTVEPEAEAPSSLPPQTERKASLTVTDVSEDGGQEVAAVELQQPISETQRAEIQVDVEPAEITVPAAQLDSTRVVIITQPEVLDAGEYRTEKEEPEAEVAASPTLTIEREESLPVTDASDGGNREQVSVEPVSPIHEPLRVESKTPVEPTGVSYTPPEIPVPAVHLDSAEGVAITTQPEDSDSGEQPIETLVTEAETPASPTPQKEPKESLTMTDISEVGSQEEGAVEPDVLMNETQGAEIQMKIEPSETNVKPVEIPVPAAHLVMPEGVVIIPQPEVLDISVQGTETAESEAEAATSSAPQTERKASLTVTDVSEVGGQEAAAVEPVQTINETQRAEFQVDVEPAEVSVQPAEMTVPAEQLDLAKGAVFITQPELMHGGEQQTEPEAEAPTSLTLTIEREESLPVTDVSDCGSQEQVPMEPVSPISEPLIVESKTPVEPAGVSYTPPEIPVPAVHLDSAEEVVITTQPEASDCGEQLIETLVAEAETPASPTPQKEPKESLTMTDISEVGSQEEGAVEPDVLMNETQRAEIQVDVEPAEVSVQPAEMTVPAEQLDLTKGAAFITQPELMHGGEQQTEPEAEAPTSLTLTIERAESLPVTDASDGGSQEQVSVEPVSPIHEPLIVESKTPVEPTGVSYTPPEITEPAAHLVMPEGAVIIPQPEALDISVQGTETVEPEAESPASPAPQTERQASLTVTDVSNVGGQEAAEIQVDGEPAEVNVQPAEQSDLTPRVVIITQPEPLEGGEHQTEPEAEMPTSPTPQTETNISLTLKDVSEDEDQKEASLETVEPTDETLRPENQIEIVQPTVIPEPEMHPDSTEGAAIIAQPELMDAGEPKIETMEPEAEAPVSPTQKIETEESLTVRDVSEIGGQEEAVLEPLLPINKPQRPENQVDVEPTEVNNQSEETSVPAGESDSTQMGVILTQPVALDAGEHGIEPVVTEEEAPASNETQKAEIQMEFEPTEVHVESGEITEPEAHLDLTESVVIITEPEVLDVCTHAIVAEEPLTNVAASQEPGTERTESLTLTNVPELGGQQVDSEKPVEPTLEAESRTQLTEVYAEAAEKPELAAEPDSAEGIITSQPVLSHACMLEIKMVQLEEQIIITVGETSSVHAAERSQTEDREMVPDEPVWSEAGDQEEQVNNMEEENDQEVWMDAEESIYTQEEREMSFFEVEEPLESPAEHEQEEKAGLEEEVEEIPSSNAEEEDSQQEVHKAEETCEIESEGEDFAIALEHQEYATTSIATTKWD